MLPKGKLRELSPQDPDPYPNSITVDLLTPCADEDAEESVTVGRAKKPKGNLLKKKG